MLHYRCYFLRKDGAAASWRNLTSEIENEAHDHALGLLVGHPDADRVEVWHQSRLTFSYSRSTAQSPAELRRLCYLAMEAAKKENDFAVKGTLASGAARLAQEAEALERGASLDRAEGSQTSASEFGADASARDAERRPTKNVR
jgi:hypothetical protein